MDKRRNLLFFAYVVFVSLSLGALFFIFGRELAETNPNSARYADFVGYYRSARMVLSKDRTRIYDRELQLKYFNELAAAQNSEQFIYSQNPPFFFLLLAPFALLPLNWSFKIWIIMSVASTCISLHLLMGSLHESKFSSAIVYTAAALLSAPGWICVSVGQMSWFITFLVSLFFFGLIRRKNVLCGIALALTASKFQYLLMLSTPLIAQRRWKIMLWAAVAEIILLAASACVIGVDNVLRYPAILFNAETTHDYIGVFPEYMISMRGVLGLFLDRHQALIGSSILMLAGLIPLSILWWHQKKHDSKLSSAWAIGATICSALLFSAHTHIYDDLLLIVAAAATLPYCLNEQQAAPGIAPAGMELPQNPTKTVEPNKPLDFTERIWTAVLLSFPVLSWICLIACNNADQVRRTPFAFINLLLLACALRAYLKSTE